MKGVKYSPQWGDTGLTLQTILDLGYLQNLLLKHGEKVKRKMFQHVVVIALSIGRNADSMGDLLA
jgi:hypothetical protein